MIGPTVAVNFQDIVLLSALGADMYCSGPVNDLPGAKGRSGSTSS